MSVRQSRRQFVPLLMTLLNTGLTITFVQVRVQLFILYGVISCKDKHLPPSNTDASVCEYVQLLPEETTSANTSFKNYSMNEFQLGHKCDGRRA